mmetsp:Transcript_16322/g.18427  ORF Transcript_16322/g.18427 Transcript_16322/m.18427 type:complete len:162 (-) Transcript_16322:284-769(-)
MAASKVSLLVFQFLALGGMLTFWYDSYSDELSDLETKLQCHILIPAVLMLLSMILIGLKEGNEKFKCVNFTILTLANLSWFLQWSGTSPTTSSIVCSDFSDICPFEEDGYPFSSSKLWPSTVYTISMYIGLLTLSFAQMRCFSEIEKYSPVAVEGASKPWY